ncbi:MAG TPA: hypothetical protein VFW34_10105 [Candidatus Rubrimentiphilum sp.]|nr:hypothetical protein [Candidatus Rubrimentiphilum sp.]
MKKIRARFLFVVIVAADVTVVFGGIPLLRDTYVALAQHAGDVPLLLQLLVANLSMMLLVVAAMFAWGMLGARALNGAFRYLPRSSARPIRASQTRYRR